MPNHISNRIQFKASEDDWKKEEEAFAQLQALMKTEDSPFDFNVLIPYPEPYKSLDEARNQAEKQLEGLSKEEYWQRQKQLPKDGYNQGGYDWCHQNWGTKWNAYEIGIDYDGISFQTAWSTPLPIWVEISKRFPDLRIEVEYADEDMGNNCGRLAYLNGKQVFFEDMSASPCAELFARAVIAEQKTAHSHAELQECKDKGL